MTTNSKRPVLVIVAAVLLAEALMVASGMAPDVLLVAALGVTVGVGIWIIVNTADAVSSVTPVGAASGTEPVQRVDRRVTRLRSSLAHSRTDSLSAERLHDSLVAIIDDQLRVAHHTDRMVDVVAATAVLGPELSAFINDPSAPESLSRPRDLDHIITLIERL